MDKIKWIIATVIFLILIALAMFSGYHLKKCPECPEIKTDTVYVTKTDTIHQSFTKFIKGKVDTVFVDSSKQITVSELIDTTVVFWDDTLDFIADINFFTKEQKFLNFFDFNLRTSQKIKEIVKEVLVPMKPEIYQQPLVIGLIAAVMFLFGLAL